MTTLLRWSRRIFQNPRVPTVQALNSNYHVVLMAGKIEEENLPWYKPDQFYPVRTGDVFRSQYRVVGKLGYGAYSTVWLSGLAIVSGSTITDSDSPIGK
jgi:serine/threonine-protein kinase SRPK3